VWRVLISLLILFIIGRIILFFVDQFEPKKNLTHTEVAVYSFSLGYVILTLGGIVLAEFGLFSPSTSLFFIITLPIIILISGLYKRQKENPPHILHEIRRRHSTQIQIIFNSVRSFFHPSLCFSHLILLIVYSAGLILRLESQLTVPWLGDMDPYYHLFFIDSIIIPLLVLFIVCMAVGIVVITYIRRGKRKGLMDERKT